MSLYSYIMGDCKLDNFTLEDKLAFWELCGYTPHEKQLEAHKAFISHRYVTVAAGARGGKSMLAGAEIAFALTIPDFRIWCVSAIYELASKELEWAIEFLGQFEMDDGRKLIDLSDLTSASRGSQICKFPWGSFARTKSTEKAKGLLGEELDLIVFGEASQVPRAPWERQLRARIGPRKGKVLPISTPNADRGLFKDFFDEGQSDHPDHGDKWSIQFSVLANPTFDREEYEKAKKELDSKVFAEQYDGKFISLKGRVLEAFSESTHIFAEFPPEFANWPVVVSVYHHQNAYNNPFSALSVAINPKDKSLWVFEELHEKQAIIADVCERVKGMAKGYRRWSYLTDYHNKTLQNNLKRNGIRAIMPDEKDQTKNVAIIRRIQALQNWIKVNEESGLPKIFVHENCKNLIHELSELKWREPQKEEKEVAEHPLPTDAFINLPMALSFVVSKISGHQGISIYQSGGRRGSTSGRSAQQYKTV